MQARHRNEPMQTGGPQQHPDAVPVVVLVAGGYGAVGGLFSRALAEETGFKVVVAGRSADKAARKAAEIGGEGRRLDLDDPATWETAVQGVDCVVMCMDQHSTHLVEFVFARGIHYIDITASDWFFRAVERLEPVRSAALLSVGLAPGLTNILAAHCVARLEHVDEVKIGLLVGLGDRHGDAGLEWIADQLFDPGRKGGGAPVTFGFGQGRRMAHRVDFSDQHAVARTLPVRAAETRMAFESRLATWALFRIAGLFAGNRFARSALLAAVRRLHIGSRMCNVSVHAHGRSGGHRAVASVHFAGEVETVITARLAAAQTALFLRRRRPTSGVWHSNEIFSAKEILQVIADRGIGRIHVDPLRAPPED